eukprot:TRINITY_DN2158_c1_g1_i2.p1 TRINITY_DN2158_c1_g1~~TRINITY_DN2158_c1_g1_i2.p1  ORF type:complete len:166 (-),score=17.04 TRINITY_DN2158_c1_g1_i2:29-526(-)
MASAAAVWSATASKRHPVAALDLSGTRGQADANSGLSLGSNFATVALGFLLGLGCLGMSAWEWYDYFDLTGIRKVEAFMKEPKMMLQATVSERGAQYAGTCPSGNQRLKPTHWEYGDDFRRCSAGPDVDRLCHDQLLAWQLTAAKIQVRRCHSGNWRDQERASHD